MASLSLNRLISTEVFLSPYLSSTGGRALLVLSDTSTNPIYEGYRTYYSLDEVGVDFDPTSPEYSAALSWFGQNPRPSILLIGRYSINNVPAHIVGTSITNLSLLTAITSGNFNITIKDTGSEEAYVRGVDLSSCADFAAVASALTSACNNAATNKHFSFSYSPSVFSVSNTTTDPLQSPDIGFMTLPREYFGFTGNLQIPTTLTIGPSSSVHSSLALTSKLLGSTLRDTLINLVNALSSSTDVNFSLYDYSYTWISEAEGYLYVQPKGIP